MDILNEAFYVELIRRHYIDDSILDLDRTGKANIVCESGRRYPIKWCKDEPLSLNIFNAGCYARTIGETPRNLLEGDIRFLSLMTKEVRTYRPSMTVREIVRNLMYSHLDGSSMFGFVLIDKDGGLISDEDTVCDRLHNYKYS